MPDWKPGLYLSFEKERTQPADPPQKNGKVLFPFTRLFFKIQKRGA